MNISNFEAHPNLRIQALTETSNKELYQALQDIASTELKIQIVPFDNLQDLVQYIERSVSHPVRRCLSIPAKMVYISVSTKLASEFQDHLNPFTKEHVASGAQSNEQAYLNCLKVIPKIGDKNAKILAQKFKSRLFSMFHVTRAKRKD